MRFYNIDMSGKFVTQRVLAHPADEQGRLYFLTTDSKLWFSDGANHYQLVAADGSSYNIGTTGPATYS